MTRRTASRPHRRARTSGAAVLAAATIAAASVLTTGALASVVAQPVPTAAPSAAAVPSASAPTGHGISVGASELRGGLELAPGLRLIGRPSATTDALGYRRWETDIDLGTVPAAAALDHLASTLRSLGFDVRRGSQDVFAARRSDGRWQIVVARVRPLGRGDDAGEVLGLGIGSRAA